MYKYCVCMYLNLFFSCFQIEEKIKMLPGQCCTFLFKVNEIVPNGVCCHIKFIDERSRKWCSCLVIIVVSWVTNAQKNPIYGIVRPHFKDPWRSPNVEQKWFKVTYTILKVFILPDNKLHLGLFHLLWTKKCCLIDIFIFSSIL